MKIIKQNFWRRISQSEIRKIAAVKKEAAKARAGENSFPPTPRPPRYAKRYGQAFLFARLIERPEFFASGRRDTKISGEWIQKNKHQTK